MAYINNLHIDFLTLKVYMGETVFAEFNTNISLVKKYITTGNINDNELRDWV